VIRRKNYPLHVQCVGIKYQTREGEEKKRKEKGKKRKKERKGKSRAK